MCPSYAVRSIFHHQKACALDQLGSAQTRSGDGQNAVRIAMNDQCGHVNARHILTEVTVPCAYAFERGCGGGGSCDIPTGLSGNLADPTYGFMAEMGKLGIGVDVFNVLNSNAPNALLYASGPTYLYPTGVNGGILPARIARLIGRFSF